MSSTFTCARCGKTEECGRSDEEAVDEMHEHFGKSIRKEECAVVCDACWEIMRPDKHPHLTEESVAETLRRRSE